MAEILLYWAGKERPFRLGFGDVLQLEEACNDAVAAIFTRVMSGRWRASDLYHILRIGLIGGGATQVQAKHLLDTFFDRLPYMENAALAGDILASIMVGIEEAPAQAEGAPERIQFSEVSQICRTFHMSPQDLKALSYAEFLNLVRGFNASSAERRAEPPTEEEFMDILARYEPEALNG